MTVYASDALRPVAGNTYVPDSMEARGKIKPIPPTQQKMRNGAGLLVPAGLWSYDWTFKVMTRAEFQWWVDLVGYVNNTENPLFSKGFVSSGFGLPAARLWDLATQPTNFQSAVIDVPEWTEYFNGLYHDVVVHFSFMRPQGF